MQVNLKTENFKSNYFENLMKSRGVEDLGEFINPNSDKLGDPANLENIQEGYDLLLDNVGPNHRIGIIVD